MTTTGSPMRSTGRRRWSIAAAELVLLFGFWVLLSGQFRPLFLGMGLVAAAIVTALTNQMVTEVLVGRPGGRSGRVRRSVWFVVFALWLLWNVAASSAQIAALVVRRGRSFRPRFVVFETELQRPVSRVAIALAITMVPGTMTVRLEGNRYLVHSLVPGAADDLVSGRMQSLIARATGEPAEPPPTMHWGPILQGREEER